MMWVAVARDACHMVCMTDKASLHSGGWMVEVMTDGPSGRHRRYLVNAPGRDQASTAVQKFFGGEAHINAISPVSAAALDAAKISVGQVVPI